MSARARPLSFTDQVYHNNKATTKLKSFLDGMEKVATSIESVSLLMAHQINMPYCADCAKATLKLQESS